MKNLILIGAGAFGREIRAWLPDCEGYGTDWVFKGFIDSSLSRLDNYGLGDEILSSIELYQPTENDVFLCTVADQNYRERYVEKLLGRGGNFISIFHKSSVINRESRIGSGVFVAPFCTISCDVSIGNNVLLNSYAAVGHDVSIGDYSHINSFTLLGGHSNIGKKCTIHPSAVILPGKIVGQKSVVGAGSIVISRVKPGSTVFGNPAKHIY